MTFGGIYRGTVEDVEDPEKRFRVRVRVITIHTHDVPVVALRWAEVSASFAAPGAVDLPHYEVGDRVFVMFEGGDKHYPIVVGSWIASRGGVDDVPADITQDYTTNRRKWSRIDRSKNMIEMSEVASELHIKLKSGKAELIISQKDDSITLMTTGAITLRGEQVSVAADQAYLDSQNITLTAVGVTDAGAAVGVLNLHSNKDLNIYVAPVADGGAAGGAVNIGQYMDTGKLTNGLIPAPHQSPKVNVYARDVNIGQYDSPTLLPTLNVKIAASAEVMLVSSTKVSLTASDVTITGDLAITGDTLATGKITATGEIQSGLIKLGTHTHPYVNVSTPATTSLPNPT